MSLHMPTKHSSREGEEHPEMSDMLELDGFTSVNYTGPEGRGLEVKIVVYGDPQTQGSKTPFAVKAGPKGGQHYTGKVALREGSTAKANQRKKNWRDTVASCVAETLADRGPIAGPVELWVTFSVARPKSHYSTSRKLPANSLLDSAPTIPESGLDGDKLQRSIQDSLKTGGAYRNDSQVARWHGAREYARDAAGQSAYGDILDRPGVVIKLRALTRQLSLQTSNVAHYA